MVSLVYFHSLHSPAFAHTTPHIPILVYLFWLYMQRVHAATNVIWHAEFGPCTKSSTSWGYLHDFDVCTNHERFGLQC